MSMHTYVLGIIPANEEFKKMKKIYDLCNDQGIDAPEEVWKYFNEDTPDEKGVTIYLDKITERVQPHDCAEGFELNIDQLKAFNPHIKIIRFVNSY